MKISTILDHIDSGHVALPEFQRGYVWNRDQVRGLFDSLYRRHPVGGLLVWVTASEGADHRGDGQLAPGVVKLLLDGQQRMTSLYGVVRGHAPKFFDGNERTFTGLYFHLEEESFSFYQPMKMADDTLWIDVSELMAIGNAGMGAYITRLSAHPEHSQRVGDYVSRLSQLISIIDIELHIDEVTGSDKSLDVVVDIFNRVNSGGTKLSKGDLALAKICAEWPEARGEMKSRIKTWHDAGYDFDLDWLLRSVNTVVTGEARFIYLHDRGTQEIKDGLSRATKNINKALNMISGRLGLDHDRVLFGRYAIPVMARYLDQRSEPLNEFERDKLLFWYLQSGMWGRFSGSTESFIDQDLSAIEQIPGGLDRLLEQLRVWHGSLDVEPAHFDSWSLGARFYPVLYMLTRMGESKDWGTGLPLKAGLLGQMNTLEVHHIFPKSKLYSANFSRAEVNALANFCFLTKDTNLAISNRLPERYFPEVEAAQSGSLESQWIPSDPHLWKVENYLDFLEARKDLLAQETNRRLADLLHGDRRWLEGRRKVDSRPAPDSQIKVLGGISDDVEERVLEDLQRWVEEQGLPRGNLAYDFADELTGEQKAVFDLAWPQGIQQELSQPVAVLLNESMEVVILASSAGYRCFTETTDFKRYVEAEVLSQAQPVYEVGPV
ncbi:MAG: DUF262 domain-containing protein [Gemmatimonadetes bacterium]|nr:DUF262 domain-containing protein [Gemmatimonadota bacterium]MYG16148.1 DUF262 domain-containing protein [Gemmatimonadota bacterium]